METASMDDLMKYMSIEEMREAFDLRQLENLARKGLLQKWLQERFLATEASILDAEKISQQSDAEIDYFLCQIFSLEIASLTSDKIKAVTEVIHKKQQTEIFIDSWSGEPDGAVVQTQAELVKALLNGAAIIYLCSGEFQIPVQKHGITYVGKDCAVIDFPYDSDFDFDQAEIRLENLQLFLHYPIAVKMEQSQNIQLLHGERLCLGEPMRVGDIYSFLQGRHAFETRSEFRQRADAMQDIAIATVFLQAKDYDITCGSFSIHPKWKWDFLPILGDFIERKSFCFQASPELARKLYTTERKFQLFAQMGADEDLPVIVALFFESEFYGRIYILMSQLPAEMEDADGSGPNGYGLELITAYEGESEG